VLEAEITTNRIDAMSHAGMAKELAAALGREAQTLLSVPARTPSYVPAVDISIAAPEMCSRYLRPRDPRG